MVDTPPQATARRDRGFPRRRVQPHGRRAGHGGSEARAAVPVRAIPRTRRPASASRPRPSPRCRVRARLGELGAGIGAGHDEVGLLRHRARHLGAQALGLALASSRVMVSSVPVKTMVLPATGLSRPTASSGSRRHLRQQSSTPRGCAARRRSRRAPRRRRGRCPGWRRARARRGARPRRPPSAVSRRSSSVRSAGPAAWRSSRRCGGCRARR